MYFRRYADAIRDADHAIFEFVRRHDYAGFLEQEIEMRKALLYPPFARLARLIVSGEEEGAVESSARQAAAWILEKFHRWSDLPDGDLWAVHSRERIIDNIMVYLATGTFGTASWLYRGVLDEPVPPGARVLKPVAVANFPGELTRYPRSMVEKSCNVVRWSEQPRGGHFAAMEQPALFVAELREFVRSLR